MKKLTSIIIICFALLLSCSSNAQKRNSQNNSNNMENKGTKTLVVFFSHAGENYNVGNIKVG